MNEIRYSSAVGSLMYLVVCRRLDIAYVIIVLGRDLAIMIMIIGLLRRKK